ncbi:UNVERIFIED_CONTAM: hypothetical protein GTU68_061501 [Idotea baltica]|nr:hypothetical protein [Idotea baltica]
MYPTLKDFVNKLKSEKELVEISCEVDPNLEAAEIHRRVISEEGPALLFTNIKGASFPLVTNLFGNKKRIDLAFGTKPEKLITDIASFPHELLPPTIKKVWSKKNTLLDLVKFAGFKKATDSKNFPDSNVNLNQLPLLTTWEEDGGAFITLPLVYTEDPITGIHNLGMYRMQRFDKNTTGLHFQIGKGGGYHLLKAKEHNKKLPVSVFLGAPPALILSAIAPLPENVPELLLASIVQAKKIKLKKFANKDNFIFPQAEFNLVGYCDPNETRPEGPFGDHYGYYSLKHDYPVFHCEKIIARKDAICAATVVGKPRQEDFYLGDYLQELLSPIFPIVMPQVKDLWSYGETGYHSLASAVVTERYEREAMAAAFRILGEGQLALTKFLLVTDKEQNLKDFKSVLKHILERCDFETDLYVFSNLSMDTLDYTGPAVNKGSKGALLGLGKAKRGLPEEFRAEIPRGSTNAAPYCAGCLVIDGPNYKEDKEYAKKISNSESLKDWSLIFLVDNVEKTLENDQSFLWTCFTRFEPGQDIFARDYKVIRNHLAYSGPIVIDARMKPWYPDELECDEKTKKQVSAKWNEYFS